MRVRVPLGRRRRAVKPQPCVVVGLLVPQRREVMREPTAPYEACRLDAAVRGELLVHLCRVVLEVVDEREATRRH